ncbi:hypothetical protein SAMN04489712_11581 [Thermomonospora echinospora]|uniref:Uncharacterized protein n=1 Tax=Thermomonospora echinospora TaxID=1992 RepID=A0A1H6DDZ7_9ACTN|nr:hypothetical protein [Thermomonospora echinospora]SEG82766.1 hypothetical protein SAMN04489712_11581 [Thermomonospora echinospora]
MIYDTMSGLLFLGGDTPEAAAKVIAKVAIPGGGGRSAMTIKGWPRRPRNRLFTWSY